MLRQLKEKANNYHFNFLMLNFIIKHRILGLPPVLSLPPMYNFGNKSWHKNIWLIQQKELGELSEKIVRCLFSKNINWNYVLEECYILGILSMFSPGAKL